MTSNETVTLLPLEWCGNIGRAGKAFRYDIAEPDRTIGWRVWVSIGDQSPSFFLTAKPENREAAVSFAEADCRARILSCIDLSPQGEPVAAEYDPDAPPDHSADNAAEFILHELAKALKVEFRPAEGSETWEGDVLGTMWHALVDSGVIDEEDNSLRVSPKSSSPQPAAISEEMVERACLSFIPHWYECTPEVKSDCFKDMRAALTAALSREA